MIITLLTDFGRGSPYAAAMRGVILGMLPGVRLEDISHEIPAGDVDYAAWVLKESAPYYPAGTVHTVVVDPGVGGSRRVLGVESRGQYYLAPDNGVLKYLFHGDASARVMHLNRREFCRSPVCPTFHGRDIFAPLAAHLAMGKTLDELGEPAEPEIRGRVALPVRHRESLEGEIVFIDSFGNAVTNLEASLISEEPAEIRVRSRSIQRVSVTYSDEPPGTLMALIGSSGCLEIAVNQGHAANTLGIRTGGAVHVRFTE
ncbi:MAG TPA: hypothetical protein ENN03_11145 [bacterium]|nr:hypothetical protein [bacterium]